MRYLFLLIFLLSFLVTSTSASDSAYDSLLRSLNLKDRPNKIQDAPHGHATESSLRVRPRVMTPEEERKYVEKQRSRELLFGGSSAKDKYPWFVELLARNGQIGGTRRCAGVMLSGDTVLTLASCLRTPSGVLADPTQSEAIIKRNELKRGRGIKRNWKFTQEHPRYVYPNLDYNVAVLTISGSPLFPQEDIGMISSDGNRPLVNSTFTALGYGELRPGEGPADTLQEAEFVRLTGLDPCNITDNNSFYCGDTVDAYNSDSSEEGDTDFCLGDEGAPVIQGIDRTLYGLYITGGTCSGQGEEAAIILKIVTFRSWILGAACDISPTNTRCVRTCSLLSGFSLGMDNFQTRLVDTALAMWDWFSSPFGGGGGGVMGGGLGGFPVDEDEM